MFKNVFLKTIYEKRWMIIGWNAVAIAFTLLIVIIFPVFRDSIGQSMKEVPESLKGFMGDLNAFQTLNGFVDIQVIYQMVFLPIIMGIILCSGLIAGKQDQGVLQTLLSQPVKRSKIYIQMLLASLVVIGTVVFSIFISTWLGAIIIHETLDLNKLFQACISIWLVSLLVSLFAYALGAITFKRGFSGMLAGIIFFVAYLVTSLAPSVKYLKYPNYLSPLKYFNTPSVILNGLRLSNVLILTIFTILFAALGYFVFIKRDIYQK